MKERLIEKLEQLVFVETLLKSDISPATFYNMVYDDEEFRSLFDSLGIVQSDEWLNSITQDDFVELLREDRMGALKSEIEAIEDALIMMEQRMSRIIEKTKSQQ